MGLKVEVSLAAFLLLVGCDTGSRRLDIGPKQVPRTSVSGSTPGAPRGTSPTPTGSEIQLDYRVTFEADVDVNLMNDYGAMLEQASALLWTTTEGQAYLSHMAIEDQRFDGDIRIPASVTYSSRTGPGGVVAFVQWAYGTATMYTGGQNVSPAVTNHELGHLAFRTDDEYNAGYAIDPCVMSLGATDAYCDRGNHYAPGYDPCWEDVVIPVAQVLYGVTMVHPNASYPAVPPTTIDIVDN